MRKTLLLIWELQKREKRYFDSLSSHLWLLLAWRLQMLLYSCAFTARSIFCLNSLMSDEWLEWHIINMSRHPFPFFLMLLIQYLLSSSTWLKLFTSWRNIAAMSLLARLTSLWGGGLRHHHRNQIDFRGKNDTSNIKKVGVFLVELLKTPFKKWNLWNKNSLNKIAARRIFRTKKDYF